LASEAVAPGTRGLPEAAIEIIASLAQHRVLSTGQVRAIHFPDNNARWTQQVLARLRGAGLVGSVRPPRSGERLWFASGRGLRLAREAHGLDGDPRPLDADDAAGRLSAHTLAVNEVGISFLRSARERGDEFGALSWRHEVAHPLSGGRGRRRRTLFADAVLTYLREEDGRLALEQRFVELDRATLSVDRLVAELDRYPELYLAKAKDGGPVWAVRYRRFPRVLCVLAGGSRPALERRRRSVVALLRGSPRMGEAKEVRISICLLEDMVDRGPFAPIFVGLRDPRRPVDWLGRATEQGEG
jgi:hypothetical protein